MSPYARDVMNSHLVRWWWRGPVRRFIDRNRYDHHPLGRYSVWQSGLHPGGGAGLLGYRPTLTEAKALCERGQANLPAVLAGLVLAVGLMLAVSWVEDHAAAGARLLARVSTAVANVIESP